MSSDVLTKKNSDYSSFESSLFISREMRRFFGFLLCVAFFPVITHFFFFAISIDAGFQYVVNNIYHLPQNSSSFYANPLLIYTHIYGNGVALLTGLGQYVIADLSHSSLRPAHPSFSPFKRCTHIFFGSIYLSSLSLGTVASILFAFKQPYGTDGGISAQISFVAMGLASLVPAWMAFIAYLLGFPSLHRQLMQRSLVSLFSSFVVFRFLARFLLPSLIPSDSPDSSYPLWVGIIWMSWSVPLLLFECLRPFFSIKEKVE